MWLDVVRLGPSQSVISAAAIATTFSAHCCLEQCDFLGDWLVAGPASSGVAVRGCCLGLLVQQTLKLDEVQFVIIAVT